MFLLIHNMNSPFLFLGAVISGIITVSITELLAKTQQIKHDAAIGMTFPFLFSIAILLINKFANNIHLDTDAVLLGELAFTPFNRFYCAGYDCGPVSLWSMSIILLINVVFISYFYKELKITTFDPEYAKLMGYNPVYFHYLLMTLTSISIIGAFNTAGTILVVALIIIPSATAYLITAQLGEMIILSSVFAMIAVCIGYIFAHNYNNSIAGSIATANGLIFFIILMNSLIKQKIKKNRLM